LVLHWYKQSTKPVESAVSMTWEVTVWVSIDVIWSVMTEVAVYVTVEVSSMISVETQMLV